VKLLIDLQKLSAYFLSPLGSAKNPAETIRVFPFQRGLLLKDTAKTTNFKLIDNGN